MTDDFGLINIDRCPACDGVNYLQYDTVFTAPYLMVDFVGGSLPMATVASYLKCEDCGLVFLSPRMTNERIDRYYASGAYRDTLGITQERMDNDEMVRAQDVTNFLEAQGVKPTAHADIGSSRNYLIQCTEAKFGCKVQGIDLNEGYATMMCGEMDGKPDLVTAIHVLEHTTDPWGELANWATMTSKWLLVEVPGLDCKGGPLRWAHTFYFPKELLERMVEDTGLEILVSETTPAHHTRILAVKD